MRDYDEDDDDKRPDYFDGDDIEEPVKQKKPVYKPDDPRYWMESSGRWDHLRAVRPPSKVWIWLFVAIVVIATMFIVWVRYLNPYVEGATQSGYVESIERRGDVFASFEGVLLPYRDLMDTTKVYQRDFLFSVENPGVAARIKELMLKGKPVRLEYKRYHAALPWRGSSPVIVTGVDSVDPSRLLPPDRNPALRRN